MLRPRLFIFDALTSVIISNSFQITSSSHPDVSGLSSHLRKHGGLSEPTDGGTRQGSGQNQHSSQHREPTCSIASSPRAKDATNPFCNSEDLSLAVGKVAWSVQGWCKVRRDSLACPPPRLQSFDLTSLGKLSRAVRREIIPGTYEQSFNLTSLGKLSYAMSRVVLG